MQPSSRVPHVVRGTFAATIATFAALVSHLAGGGAVPGPVGVVTPLVLSVLVCVVLAGRRLSLLRLLISVIVSQLLFHTLFVLGTGTGAAGSGSGSGSASGPAHHDHSAMLLTPVAPSTMESVQGSAAMWAAHAAAAAVTVLVLHRGERTLEHLIALAARLAAWLRIGIAAVPAAAPVVLRRTRSLRAASRGWSLHPLIQAASQRRRGPPALGSVLR